MNFMLEIMKFGAFDTQQKEYNMNCTLEGMFDGEAMVRVYDSAGNFTETTISCQTKLHTWNVYGLKEQIQYTWEKSSKTWRAGVSSTNILAEFALGERVNLYECEYLSNNITNKLPEPISRW